MTKPKSDSSFSRWQWASSLDVRQGFRSRTGSVVLHFLGGRGHGVAALVHKLRVGGRIRPRVLLLVNMDRGDHRRAGHRHSIRSIVLRLGRRHALCLQAPVLRLLPVGRHRDGNGGPTLRTAPSRLSVNPGTAALSLLLRFLEILGQLVAVHIASRGDPIQKVLEFGIHPPEDEAIIFIEILHGQRDEDEIGINVDRHEPVRGVVHHLALDVHRVPQNEQDARGHRHRNGKHGQQRGLHIVNVPGQIQTK